VQPQVAQHNRSHPNIFCYHGSQQEGPVNQISSCATL
jgi:hypothetical protein